jgi:hypothetical protein
VIRNVFDGITMNLKMDTKDDGSAVPVENRVDVVVDQFTQLRQRLLASRPGVTDSPTDSSH